MSTRHTILYSGQTDHQHRSVVAIIVTSKVEKVLLDWKPISDRVMIKTRFNSKFAKLIMIACYAPTEDAEEEIKDELYEQVKEEIRTTPGVTYSWWWDTSTEELEGTLRDEKGPWAPDALDASITTPSTVRGFLCAENNLVIGGTIFKHRCIHKSTYAVGSSILTLMERHSVTNYAVFPLFSGLVSDVFRGK